MRALLAGCALVLSTSSSFAAGEPCWHDTDCPGNGADCGGDICNRNRPGPGFPSDKPYICSPAGEEPVGRDGACSTVEHCKCAGDGASCVGGHCTITRPGQEPASQAGSGGTSSGGGAPSGAGTNSLPNGAAGAVEPARSRNSDGCSVAVGRPRASRLEAVLMVLGFFAVAFAARSKRRASTITSLNRALG